MDEDEAFPVHYPEPVALTDAEFDVAVSEGKLLEHHRELFVHSLDVHRMGWTREAIKEVRSGFATHLFPVCIACNSCCVR